MSVLENKLRLNEKIDLRNTPLPLKVFKCNYELRPESGELDRRTALIMAETTEHAAQLIKSTVQKGMPFLWETMPYQIGDIHGITPSLERALFIKLKQKYEGKSLVEKLKRSKK